MTVHLALKPQEESRLLATARAKGISLDDLVQEAVQAILASQSCPPESKEPTLSLRGLVSQYGPAPSEEKINQNRADMFANFPRDDF